MPLLTVRFTWIKLKALKFPQGVEGHVYKLNKSLYGLKQAGENLSHVFHCFLLENSFVQSPVDNCVYTKHVGSGFVAMLVWVDDIIIAASNISANANF